MAQSNFLRGDKNPPVPPMPLPLHLSCLLFITVLTSLRFVIDIYGMGMAGFFHVWEGIFVAV